MDRRLTTLLAADLVGYSHLISLDEEGVIARVRAARADVVEPLVSEAGGRIVKTMGDGLLIEFGSPVAAVRAALAIQQAMAAAEAGPEESRLRFRIGIHLGDVVVEGDDFLGDGVNMAARLETLAPAGGVCISRAVHEQVRGKLDATLTSLGPQPVKNLPEPVEVWRVEVEGADVTSPAAPGTRPSIAVLPFDNMSRDADQDYLADGLVEDVITALSRFRELTVIARNSSFSFRGQASDIRRVGRELGARYVVEGSVRRAGDRLRLTAQLIDAADGSHVWAGRWDRTMEDLFDLQDELTGSIVGAVAPEIGAHERALAARKPTESLTSWELAQRAHAEFLRYSPDSIAVAKALAERAIAVDPGSGLAYTILSRAHASEAMNRRSADRDASLESARIAAERAIELDSRNDVAHTALAFALRLSGRFDESLRVLERAHALNPNNATTLFHLAATRMDHPTIHEPAIVVAQAREALRLSPTDPFAWVFETVAGLGLAQEGNFEAALEPLESALSHANSDWKPALAAAVAALGTGRREEARGLLVEALTRRPELTLESAMTGAPTFGIPPLRAMTEQLVELGLPSGSSA